MSSQSFDTVGIYLREIVAFRGYCRVRDCLHKTCKVNAKLDKQNDSQVQRLERSPTRAELAAEVNKTEAQLTQIQKLGQLAKQKMITANLRLVVAVAKKCRRFHGHLRFSELSRTR